MRLRVAIIGAGLMGHWHAHTAKNIGAEITAIIDSNMEAAGALAARFGGRSFPDFQQALAEASFDCLHICTPLDSHVALAHQALSADKHVIVEKPITASASELEQLLELSASKGRLLCPVHQFAFQPGVLKVKEVLALRASEPLAVSFDFASAGGEGRDSSELNQILLEILPHPLSILTSLWPVDTLMIDSWHVDNPQPGELIAQGQHQGVPVSLRVSLRARPTHCKMTVYHQQGAMHVNLFHGFVVFESAVVSRFSKITSPFFYAFKQLLAASLNLLQRAFNREPAYPGLRVLISQCYEAIGSGASQPISGQNARAITRACEVFKTKITG